MSEDPGLHGTIVDEVRNFTLGYNIVGILSVENSSTWTLLCIQGNSPLNVHRVSPPGQLCVKLSYWYLTV